MRSRAKLNKQVYSNRTALTFTEGLCDYTDTVEIVFVWTAFKMLF